MIQFHLDGKIIRILLFFLIKKKKLRVQNFRGNQQMPKMSDQKRQILISNAFRKLYSTESLSQDQTVEIRLDNSNFDNPPTPTT